ncbi:MAG: R3H domain-containing nucleic acid-binding protein [Chloroflexota bacterium]
MQKVITDDLEALVNILPTDIRKALNCQKDIGELVEVVLDLGRPPEARFPKREVILRPEEVTLSDIDHVVSGASAFSGDNRAGIERTLHRISAIRNRQGRVIGLTCRIGRAVFGTIKIIEDLVSSSKSLLLLGRPGIGKTTMLREIARVLADDLDKRVVIVDTSNEIAGDGDIPHPAIGSARRMQVSAPSLQHAVMIEAVENHMPEVIIVDEIGTELEARAARTIAERGVQLVGTAHGNTLDNLMMNPTLADLIGGIQTVTLGDEEAKRRGTQKSILERTAPPTFDIVVEIQDRDRVAIHPDVAESVDGRLRGQSLATEVRWLDEQGEVRIEKASPALPGKTVPRTSSRESRSPRIFLFGTNRGRLEQMARERDVKLDIVTGLSQANLLLTAKSYYRRKPPKIKEAEAAGIPLYVLKSNTPNQIRQFLDNAFPREKNEKKDPLQLALDEAEKAVSDVMGGQEMVELSPQSAYIRRLQHLIAERNDMASRSMGREPQRRVRIYR